jgi:hypothetical protein
MIDTTTQSPEELPSRKRLALRYILTYLVAILATSLVVVLKDKFYDYEGENASVLVFLYVGTYFPNGIFRLFGQGAIFGSSDLALFLCTAVGYVLVLSLFSAGLIWRKRNIYLVFVLLLILNFGGCVLRS